MYTLNFLRQCKYYVQYISPCSTNQYKNNTEHNY